MRYLSHFGGLLGSILLTWAVLFVVGIFIGFDNGWWLTGLLLFGVLGPLMVLWGGVRTAIRRWRWRDYGLSGLSLPLMYHEGTEQWDAEGHPLLTGQGTPVLVHKPPIKRRDGFSMALLAPQRLILCRAADAPGRKPAGEVPWNDLEKVLADIPLRDWKGAHVELFDVEEVRQKEAVLFHGQIYFTALLRLVWRVEDGQRCAVFSFSGKQGSPEVREVVTLLLTEAGVPVPKRLLEAGEDKLVASQGVAEGVAAYLRAWAG